MLSQMANEGSLKGVKYLIENGASVHALNDYALRWAIGKPVVKYLIQNGANIHAIDYESLRLISMSLTT